MKLQVGLILSGLIGWVHNCDTLNEIINEFRASQSPPILPKVELKVLHSLSNGTSPY